MLKNPQPTYLLHDVKANASVKYYKYYETLITAKVGSHVALDKYATNQPLCVMQNRTWLPL